MASNLFDSANYPIREPQSLTAGEFWAWKRPDLAALYSPTIYTLTYYLKEHGGNTSNSFSSTAPDFVIEIPSATTASYQVGHIHFQLWIIRNSDSEKIELESGHFDVVASFSGSVDPRSHAELMLEKIESLLENRADSDITEYSINDRQITKMGVTELLKWRSFYKAEVVRENRAQKIKNGSGMSRKIYVRF